MSEGRIHIAACRVCCSVCGLHMKGICRPCGSGLKEDREVVDKKMEEQRRNLGHVCPKLQCVTQNGIGYCMKDCRKFPCKFYEEDFFPYSEGFLTMFKSRNR